MPDATLHYVLLTTVGLYALTAVLYLARRRAAAVAANVAAFLAATAAVVIRWVQVEHLPLQNLFEVFVSLGVLIPPVTVFSLRFLKVGVEWGDAVLGGTFVAVAALAMDPSPQRLPAALQSLLFGPHVASYMLAYAVLAKAALQAAAGLMGFRERTGLVPYEQAAHRMVQFGFPLLTLGLVLGALWGKLAWGDWWNWDPKELWSLATWLTYVGYLHFRGRYGGRFHRANCYWVLVGFALVLVTLLWVNLSRLFGGLHSYAM
jgi:ABC-type transport system involved in cytochrome c biogenesis permease subunit